ncbi:MAG: 7-cyano-7-deazaguanine synthase [Candidatus Poribacteria bacterium]|nr:7-cyano-7-deazaguanine synthase [Candidatus Poribacteria bacterium]
MKRALLLSGGMDSVSIAYWQHPDLAITIDYGQKPALGEIRAASAVCTQLNIIHYIIKADISQMGSGDLAGTSPAKHAPANEWWPYRNQFLLTVAAMHCYNQDATRLLIGALRTDGFHKDGTQDFIDRMNAIFALQEGDLIIEAPAIKLDAVELVRESGVPRDILSWSHSCHVAEYACGFCRGCRKHYETMETLDGIAY